MRLLIRCAIPALFEGLCLVLVVPRASSQCEIAEIAGSAASLKDGTGRSVALDGATGVAGSPLDDPLGTDSGSAYVLERRGASWVETAFLVPADGAAEDEFGSAVAVDGDIIVVGAPLDDDWGFDSGSAYVFERAPTGWTETAKLHASDASPFDEFGNAVAIDGGTCVIGTGYAGNAYVFELQGGVWVETAKLVTGLVWSWGPVSVDGDVVALGTPDLAGAAHVFEKEGGTWGPTATLLPSGTPGVDHFGTSLSVSGDRILIGASSDDDAAHSAGAAYLFEKQGGTWIEAVKLHASDPHQNAGFGGSVVLSGGDAAVGAAAANGKGAVYHFQEVQSGWVEVSKLVAGDALAGDGFGRSIGFSAGMLLTGSPSHDAPGFEFDAGAVYLHSLYLCADVDAIPLSTGGAQTLSLTAGPAHAGDVHLVLGSFTGTAGFDLGGFLVPLDVDLYFLHTLAHPNAPPLAGSLGFLDGAGAAAATFTLPAGLPSSLAGATFYHACGVLDPATVALEIVSAPVAVDLVP